jgi:hypothetical protein
MIWILLSIGYAAIGYLYADAAWNSPEVKEEVEELLSTSPEGSVEAGLAIAKLIIAVFWAVFFLGSIGAYILQVLGIISPSDEEEE